MVRCLVFDFDGTLVQSNEIKQQAFYKVAGDLVGSRGILDEVLWNQSFGDRYAVFDHLVEKLNLKKDKNHNPDRLAARYSKICEEMILAAPYVKGALESLEVFHQLGLVLAISSATPQIHLKPIVVGTGFKPYMSEIFGGPKTKEQHIEFLKTKYGLMSNEIVYIGDSQVDYDAANKSGCHFIGIGESSHRFSFEPSILLPDLTLLPSVIGRFYA